MSAFTRAKTTIGSYRNLAGADILVIDRSESDDTLLTPIVTAHCGGHGCPADAPKEHYIGSMYLSRINRGVVIADAAKPVQEWAQQHAETCRANPAPGPHPAEEDLPTCGAADPEGKRSCQLANGHGWKHAAYTTCGLRERWDDQTL
jgi:hypothetical protein